MPSAQCVLHGHDDLIDRLLKGMCVAFARGEGAELTGENADVRVIDVAVVDVGGEVAVLPLPHRVGHDAERVQIVAAVKLQRFLFADALACGYLFRDRAQFIWNERKIHGKERGKIRWVMMHTLFGPCNKKHPRARGARRITTARVYFQ